MLWYPQLILWWRSIILLQQLGNSAGWEMVHAISISKTQEYIKSLRGRTTEWMVAHIIVLRNKASASVFYGNYRNVIFNNIEMKLLDWKK